MSLLQVVLLLLGISLYFLVMWDVLKTTLSLHGGGPLTMRLTRFVNFMIGRSDEHRRNNPSTARGVVSRVAHYSHLLLTSTLFVTWFLGLVLSMILILSSDPQSIPQVSERSSGAAWLHYLFFAGSSLTTAGSGSLGPQGVWWQSLTVLMAFSGLIVSSLGIAYVISLVNAVVSQRRLARQISNLGACPRQILATHHKEGTFVLFGLWCESISEDILQHTQQHHAYPMVHFVRADDARDSLPTAIANLDETLSILLFEVPTYARPNLHQLLQLRRAITAYLKSLDDYFTEDTPPAPPWPQTNWLVADWGIAPVREQLDLPTAEQAALDERRGLLYAAVNSQGHEWSDMSQLLSPPTASELDADLLALHTGLERSV